MTVMYQTLFQISLISLVYPTKTVFVSKNGVNWTIKGIFFYSQEYIQFVDEFDFMISKMKLNPK